MHATRYDKVYELSFGSSVPFISKFCPSQLFFDSALRTYTVRFLGLVLVRLAAVRLLGDRFVLAL